MKWRWFKKEDRPCSFNRRSLARSRLERGEREMEYRVRFSSSAHSRTFQWFRTEKSLRLFGETLIPLIIGFWRGWENLISSTEIYFPRSSLYPTKMAPRDQLSSKDRKMEQSKRKMLFESKRTCRIWIPLEILSFVDLKILKIGLEMAELAI